MIPFNGCADQIFGPNQYGYVDAGSLVLGEKGGRYLIAYAVVVQQPRDRDGNRRLPVWSDARDRIVVACPPSVRLKTVEDPEPYEDWLVWVDRIDRDPSKYRHDLHPMDPRCAIMDMDWTTAERMVFDSIAKPAREKAKTFNFMSPLPNTLVTDPRLLTIPVFDENDQSWKQWKVSETSKLVQELVAIGKIKRTSGGRYYVVPEGSVTIKKNAS